MKAEHIEKLKGIDLPESVVEELLAKYGAKVWTPEVGERYKYRQEDGLWRATNWTERGGDHRRFELGNAYPLDADTDAIDAVTRATVTVRRWIHQRNAERGWKANWGDTFQSKYFLFYQHHTQKWCVEKWRDSQHAIVEFYLSTRQDVLDLIAAHEAELDLMYGIRREG